MPHNPLELAKQTEEIVVRDGKRPYRSISVEPFYRQIASARSVGCNLRCRFCWIDKTRDYPRRTPPDTRWLTPEEVYEELMRVSNNGIMTEFVRITGCEPTIGREYLLSFLEVASVTARVRKRVLLETNGILLGADESYVKALRRYINNLSVRLSFKAGPTHFQQKTGAKAEYYDYQLAALRYLEKHGIPFWIASMTRTAWFTSLDERRKLFLDIADTSNDPRDLFTRGLLEEEEVDLFGITRKRLMKKGLLPEEASQQDYEPLSASITRKVVEKLGITLEVATQESILEARQRVSDHIASLGKDGFIRLIQDSDFKVNPSCTGCHQCGKTVRHLVEDDSEIGKL